MSATAPFDPFCTNGNSPPLTEVEYDFVARYLEEGNRAFTSLPHHLRSPWKIALNHARFITAVWANPGTYPLEQKLRKLLATRPAATQPEVFGKRTGVTFKYASEIRAQYAEGSSLGKLAEAYNCSRTTIARIVAGVERAA